jgi:hypothetical protein
MSSSFFIFAPSNTKDYADNQPNKFRMHLPKPLYFNGNWVVGLHSISYPYSWPSTIGTQDHQAIFIHFTDDKGNDRYIKVPVPEASHKQVHKLGQFLSKSLKDQGNAILQKYKENGGAKRFLKNPSISSEPSAKRKKRDIKSPSASPPHSSPSPLNSPEKSGDEEVNKPVTQNIQTVTQKPPASTSKQPSSTTTGAPLPSTTPKPSSSTTQKPPASKPPTQKPPTQIPPQNPPATTLPPSNQRPPAATTQAPVQSPQAAPVSTTTQKPPTVSQAPTASVATPVTNTAKPPTQTISSASAQALASQPQTTTVAPKPAEKEDDIIYEGGVLGIDDEVKESEEEEEKEKGIVVPTIGDKIEESEKKEEESTGGVPIIDDEIDEIDESEEEKEEEITRGVPIIDDEIWATDYEGIELDYAKQLIDSVEIQYIDEFERFKIIFKDDGIKRVSFTPQLGYVLGWEDSKNVQNGEIAKYGVDLRGGFSSFAVYTKGLTENMIVGNTLSSLLRVVSISGAHPGEYNEKIYDSPIFCRVLPREINEIEIELRTMDDGRLIPFAFGTVLIVLIFKKVINF